MNTDERGPEQPQDERPDAAAILGAIRTLVHLLEPLDLSSGRAKAARDALIYDPRARALFDGVPTHHWHLNYTTLVYAGNTSAQQLRDDVQLLQELAGGAA